MPLNLSLRLRNRFQGLFILYIPGRSRGIQMCRYLYIFLFPPKGKNSIKCNEHPRIKKNIKTYNLTHAIVDYIR